MWRKHSDIKAIPPDALPVWQAFLVFSAAKPGSKPLDLFDRATGLMSHVPGKRVRPRWSRLRVGLAGGGVAAVLVGTYADLPDPDASGLAVAGVAALGWAAWPWLLREFGDRYTRMEPDPDTLLEKVNKPATKRNLRSLEEFRVCLATGPVEVFVRRPDGSSDLLSTRERRIFLADGGRAFIIWDDWDQWRKVRARPLPNGQILIRIGDQRSHYQLSSKTLVDDLDDDRFAARCEWIRKTALASKIPSTALLKGLKIISGLRDTRIRPLTPAQAALELHRIGKPTASESAIAKYRSGNYAEFETALQKLPLEMLP